MGIWENLGMGGYRGFSRPAARLLQQAVQLAGDLGCEQADTSHLLLAMLQQQGAAAQFLTRKNITEPEVRRQLAQQRSGPAQRLDRQSMAPDLRRTMDYALIGAQNAHVSRAEPEHLLCAMLEDDSCAAGLLLASAGYVALIDKAAPFEADRYYVVIYAAVVLAVAVVLARLAPQHETLLLLALVPILAAHRTDPNAYLYEDAAPRKAALADTERLPAVVLNKAGYEVAPDLFLEEFAKREAVDQASGEDDAASLRAAVESRDLHDGFLLYGYNYDAAVLRALAEDTLDMEKIELVTDGERCPVYYIELK